jgi:RND family efflux transporter MFP subunit
MRRIVPVTSPIGVGIRAGVSEGEELFRLIRDNRIEWQAEVPLRQTFGLKVGTPARIPTPIGDVTGKIRRIAPSASDTNGRVKVYVDIDQLPGDIEPKIGVMISGRFQTGEDSALHVPSSAVVLQDGFAYVFVLEDGDTVRRQRVETGRRQDNRVEITSDLKSDAQVVQSGGAFLTDGSRVRVTDAAPVETSALSAETPAETPETSAEGAAE